MAQALYGPDGFYTRPGPGPAAHFRTSAHASPIFAGALARLLSIVDTALGRPDPLDVVDVGAGRGELLIALLAAVPPETAAATKSMPTNNRPLPRNTVAKNRSSRSPIRSRSTPMNHKKAMPANGITMSAARMRVLPAPIHPAPAKGSAGIAARSRIRLVANSRA